VEGINVGRFNPADCIGQPLHGKDEIKKLLQVLIGGWSVYHLNIVLRSRGYESVPQRVRLKPDDPGVKEFAEYGNNFPCSGSSTLIEYQKHNSVSGPGYEVKSVAVFLDASE